MSDGPIARLSTAEQLLEEIQDIKSGGFRSSIQTARHLYASGDLPHKLADFLNAQQFSSKAEAARFLSISPASVERTLRQNYISENMLYRIEAVVVRSLHVPGLSKEQASELEARPWRLTAGPNTQAMISSLSGRLAKLIEALKESNEVGSEQSPINTLQRAQLVAMLEAALASLRGPAVNAKETGAVFRWLGRILKRSGEKSVERNVTDAMNSAFSEGVELIGELAQQPGLSDIDKIV